jgi:hypothetical protein
METEIYPGSLTDCTCINMQGKKDLLYAPFAITAGLNQLACTWVAGRDSVDFSTSPSYKGCVEKVIPSLHA